MASPTNVLMERFSFEDLQLRNSATRTTRLASPPTSPRTEAQQSSRSNPWVTAHQISDDFTTNTSTRFILPAEPISIRANNPPRPPILPPASTPTFDPYCDRSESSEESLAESPLSDKGLHGKRSPHLYHPGIYQRTLDISDLSVANSHHDHEKANAPRTLTGARSEIIKDDSSDNLNGAQKSKAMPKNGSITESRSLLPTENPSPIGGTTKSSAHWQNNPEVGKSRNRVDVALKPGDPDFPQHFIRNNPTARRGLTANQGPGIYLEVSSQVCQFLTDELDAGSSLWDLVVLTGGPENVSATTCGRFVESTWPGSTDLIKSVFEQLQYDSVKNRRNSWTCFGDRDSTIGNDIRLFSGSTTEPVKLYLGPGRETRHTVDLVEAISWLAAVTQSDQGGPFASSTFLNLIHGNQDGLVQSYQSQLEDAYYSIEYDAKQPITEKNWSNTCWLPLAPHTAVASDFGTPRRGSSCKGLEASFELICYLCGLKYASLEEGGIVLYGHRSVVYPVRSFDDSVEWHFQPCDRNAPETWVIRGSRLIEEDLQILRDKKRHFLGIWPNPEITLGTDRVDFSTLTWSKAVEMQQELVREGREVGGALQLPRLLQVQWTEKFTVAKSRKNVYMDDFESKIQSMINTPVILYSPSEERAWLVSYMSLLLHLSRARASFQQDLGYHIPACRVSADGGRAAFELLQRVHQQPIKGSFSNAFLAEGEKYLTVQDYVEMVHSALECLKRETYKANSLLGMRKQLIGYEMADIARIKNPVRMKTFNMPFLSSGWSGLLDQIHLAMFYEGAVDPVSPSAPDWHAQYNPFCAESTWKRTPFGHNLLTASLPCLLYICEHLNGNGKIRRLTPDHYWHNPGTHPFIFTICPRQERHVCNKLQELKSRTLGRKEVSRPSTTNLKQFCNGQYSSNMLTTQERLSPLHTGRVLDKSKVLSLFILTIPFFSLPTDWTLQTPGTRLLEPRN